MPTLICDLRPQAAELFPEYHALREAGEAVTLFAPAPLVAAALAPVDDAATLQATLDDEQIALLNSESLPDWLALDDYHRVLMISDGPTLTPKEKTLADSLLARGCEAIEVLRPADALDLAQSWFSGRRTAARLLR